MSDGQPDAVDETLSALRDDVVALDGRYTPFENVDRWTSADYDHFWDERLNAWTERSDTMPAETGGLRSRALDAAALDTGALERLYDLEPGVTVSVLDGVAQFDVERLRHKTTDQTALIDDQREAYNLAFDVATGQQPLTESLIRQIHALVCRSQPTYVAYTEAGPQDRDLSRGVYKDQPNHVRQADGTWFSYAPVLQTPSEVARLVEQARQPAFSGLSPVAQSAYLHDGLSVIHPFSDGNGRVSRVVASIPLLRAYSLPLWVSNEERAAYLDALRHADRGNFRPLIVDFALRTANLAERLMRPPEPADTGWDGLQQLRRDRLGDDSLPQAATCLREWVTDEMRTLESSVPRPFKLIPVSRSAPGRGKPISPDGPYAHFATNWNWDADRRVPVRGWRLESPMHDRFVQSAEIVVSVGFRADASHSADLVVNLGGVTPITLLVVEHFSVDEVTDTAEPLTRARIRPILQKGLDALRADLEQKL